MQHCELVVILHSRNLLNRNHVKPARARLTSCMSAPGWKGTKRFPFQMCTCVGSRHNPNPWHLACKEQENVDWTVVQRGRLEWFQGKSMTVIPMSQQRETDANQHGIFTNMEASFEMCILDQSNDPKIQIQAWFFEVLSIFNFHWLHMELE